MPLRTPELVERQHVYMLHRVAEALTDAGHILHVLLRRGEPGNQHEAHQIFLPLLFNRCPKSMVGWSTPRYRL